MNNVGRRFWFRLLRTLRPGLFRLPRGGDRLLRLIASGYARSPSPVVVGRILGGVRMRLDLRDRVQRHLYYLGVYERAETRCLVSLLGPGDCFADIGAHIGYYTLIAASLVGPAGRVYAFEPDADNLLALRHNADLNVLTNVEALPLGVWDRVGCARFTPSRVRGESGWGVVSATGDDKSLAIDVTTVDAFCEEHGITRLDGMKVDVEGGEATVLRGMEHTISALRPRFLLIEITRRNSDGFSPARQIIEVLHKHDYVPRVIAPSGPRHWTPSDDCAARLNVLFTRT